MNYNINNTVDVIPDDVEKEILKILNKKPPECYAKLSYNEEKTLKNNIINNPEFKKYNISIEQIQSIRSSYIKNKMIKNHKNLIKNTNNIIKDYNNKINILELSKKYDGSPLNIMRVILLKTHSKEQVKKIFNKPELLNDYDLKQFEIAKNNDDFALINQDEILKKATDFEKQIEKILVNSNIEFSTQEELSIEQIKTHGKPVSTPDFLLKTELKINKREIKWIDAKNFYGSDVNFVKTKIEEQTKKYLKNYGNGCIIFNLGFNEKYLNNDNILFLSWKIFKNL